MRQDRLEDQTLKREVELAEEAEKAAEPVPEKSWEDTRGLKSTPQECPKSLRAQKNPHKPRRTLLIA